MVKMQEKRNQQLTQNIQMMTTEMRTDEPRISIVTRRGAVTSSDKMDGKKEYESAWVRKPNKKAPIFIFRKKKKYLWKQSEVLWIWEFDL